LTHLSKAMVLQGETQLGYPMHVGLLNGHLACASEELVRDTPELASRIRTVRIAWFANLERGTQHCMDIEEFIQELHRETQVEMSTTSPWVASDFRIVRQAKVLGHLSEAAEECMEIDAEMAPQIITMLGMWAAGIQSGDEPDLQYEGLFDSLLTRMDK